MSEIRVCCRKLAKTGIKVGASIVKNIITTMDQANRTRNIFVKGCQVLVDRKYNNQLSNLQFGMLEEQI
jgi:hypothetical protein